MSLAEPAQRTVQAVTAEALAREPSRQALEFNGRWYGWGELKGVADRIDGLLDAARVDVCAPVAFIARNRPSSLGALLGLLRAGRYIRMVYPFQSPASIARALDAMRPAAVILMAEDDGEAMRQVLRERGLAGIVLGLAEADPVPGCERTAAAWTPPVHGPDIQLLTSGTTGLPKPFSVSYELIARDMIGSRLFSPAPGEDGLRPPVFMYFPIGNISGLTTVPLLLNGERVCLVDRFSVDAWRDYVRRHRPVAVALPPASVQLVLDADIPPEELASVRFIPSGAAPLDSAIHRAFEARYGVPILMSYGATEFAGAAAMMTPQLHAQWGEAKFGSVGRPLPGIEVRIVDPQTRAVLPAGEEGMLEVVASRVGPDWIRTADIGVMDADGFLFIRGRNDGAIMRGGFKLLPEEIERALSLHQAVSACAVVGAADRRLGEVPAAAIQLKPGVAQPSETDLAAHLREHLPATHIPAAWRFVDELPKNPSFKIDRGAVKRLFAD
jgi:acyl-CoA synthetase (AMP-forming)/AMP-acid ligase II